MNECKIRSMGNKMLRLGRKKKSRFTALVQKDSSSYHIKTHSSHFLFIPSGQERTSCSSNMNKIKVIFGRKNSCSEHVLKKTLLICDSDDAFGAQHIPLHQETHIHWLSTIYTQAKGLCWLNNKVGILCQHMNGDLKLKCHL